LRQAAHCKGRNRYTAWFAIIDKDWPCIRGAFEVWLAPENFDNQGNQKTPLERTVKQLKTAGIDG
jgi:hypothetical protein